MRRKSIVLASLFLACLVYLFYPGLFQSQVPAFRDAYHFYYPQAVWLDQCAQRGELFPSWNPSEGLGVSVTGQPSSALFYPLRVVWLLPWLSVAQRFSIVIVVHLWLAAAGIRYAAHQLSYSQEAAWLAAISYGLCCPIVFQHSNLIYLCSASWLGFALGALVCVLKAESRDSRRSCLVFAVACSLMLLAGDPQTAVNTLIVAGLALLGHACLGLTGGTDTGQLLDRRLIAIGLRSGAWMVVATLLVGFATAVQWIPAMRWSQHSHRLQNGSEVATETSPELASLIPNHAPPKARTYDFSLSPWHVATGLWPTLGGSYLPRNSRLFSVIPAEGRMWIPSIYMGCLPGLCVLATFFKWRTSAARWWIALALFSLLAAFGNYSPMWLTRESLNAIGLGPLATLLPKDHVSSLYWLLTKLVPGYELFRYPAKWTVFFAAACSLLAGWQLNDWQANNWQHSRWSGSRFSALLPQRTSRWLLGLSGLGVVVSISLWLAAVTGHSVRLDHLLERSANDAWFGPPATYGVASSLFTAFCIPLAIMLLLYRMGGLRPTFLIVITLIEMTGCATQWVCFVPAPHGLNRPPTSETPAYIWSNRAQANFSKDGFALSSSTFPIAQTEYQAVFLLGKLATLADVGDLGASQSIATADSLAICSWLAGRDRLSTNQPELDQVLQELGVTHRMIRTREPGQQARFGWQAVPNPGALCELQAQPSDPQKDFSSTVDWSWLGCDVLQIRVQTGHDSSLVVRQFNDGGWQARNADGKRLALDSSGLWLKLQLPPGEQLIQLERKWLW